MSIVLPIDEDPRFRRYTATGGQTQFSVPFPFQQDEDVAVLLKTPSGWSELDRSLYTLTGAGIAGGGMATFLVGRTAGEIILVLGRAVLDRLSSIVTNGRYKSKTTDDEFDRSRLIQQEQSRDIGRALKVDFGAAPQTLPAPVAGNVLGWSSDQTLINRPDVGESVEAAQAAAAQAGEYVAGIPETVATTEISFPASRTLREKMQDLPFVEDWGALGDGVNDDRASIQAAMNAELRIFFRHDKQYMIDGGLKRRRFSQLSGFGSSNSDGFFMPTGAPKLRFVGTGGGACIENADPLTMMSHGHMSGLVLRAETSQYTWVVDFKGCVKDLFQDLAIQVTGLNTGGFRSSKIADGDDSWINVFDKVSIRLPDDSVARTLDIDWSDSRLTKLYSTGGRGAIERGYGCVFEAPQFERSNYAGLTILKKYPVKMTQVIGGQADANKTHGIVIDVTGDVSGQTSLDLVIANMNFRTVDPNTGVAGSSDILLNNPTGSTFYFGTLSGNTHSVGAVPPLQKVGSWQRAKIVGEHVRDTSSAPFGENDPDLYVDPRGINVPSGAVVARGARTLRNQPNTAGFFGGLTANGAGVALGTSGGVPFVAATRDETGVDTGLAIHTAGVERVRVTASGDFLRPASDNYMSIGTPSGRMKEIFAAAGTINTSDARRKSDVSAIPDAVLDAWGEIEWLRYHLEEGQRWHTGIIAQNADAAFDAHGEDARAYGFLCFDEWDAEFEEHDIARLDEDGNPVMETILIVEKTRLAREDGSSDEVDIESTRQEPVVDRVTVTVREAGSLWGIRYDEALAIEAAYQRRRSDRIEARLAALEAG